MVGEYTDPTIWSAALSRPKTRRIRALADARSRRESLSPEYRPVALALPISMHDLVTPDDLDTCRAHCFDSRFDIARFQIHAPARIHDKVRSESERPGVHCRELHAVIGGQAADVHIGDALLRE